MITAKALVKQLSVLEIPDGRPGVIVWRTDAPGDLYPLTDALGLAGVEGLLITISPDDELTTLSDEDLDRMGLQRK